MAVLFYLSHGLVRVCQIVLSYMGKNNGIPNLVCEKVGYFNCDFAVMCLLEFCVSSLQCIESLCGE